MSPVAISGEAGRQPSPASVPPPTLGDHLYRDALVLDGNSTPSIGQLCCNEQTKADLAVVRDCGITALKTTLGGFQGSFEEAVNDIADAQNLIERYPDLFIKVARHDDLGRAKREKKVALIFSFEAATMLGDKLDRIELFRKLGVLVMQLSYNHKSPLGCGCLDGDSDGVTKLGREAIAKMNALGVALDLSHANTATTADGIALSTKPVLISHAGCRAVFSHPRNKDDREMKALADKGGVMGIYMLPFLTEDTRQPMLEDYMRHMTHALNVCGEDHVGMGTDTNVFEVTESDLKAMAAYTQERIKKGVAAPGENRPLYIPDLNTPRKLERVADALLSHGYSARVAEKVLGLNFSRVFNDIWMA
ncbi:Zn-dependent dipeptidase [Dyella tabacisoli]|uniref:Zn-dependent dipeptidase n=2 Tax=Dyella tabacisoli TaxID=2282381 RepID=A0A369USB5_9GAMM|nr:Zn-dependent dipeptidase [Dyella tabacisoli]